MVQGSGFRVQGSGLEGAVHCRNREAAFTQRSRESKRIANATEHRRGITPERAAPGECRNGVRVVLEARHVRDRVALNVARGVSGGARRELSFERACGDQRMLIEIAEGVDGRDAKTSACRGFGRRPRGHSGHHHVGFHAGRGGRIAQFRQVRASLAQRPA